MLRAEPDLARARLAASDGDPATAAAFEAAVSSLRELSNPLPPRERAARPRPVPPPARRRNRRRGHQRGPRDRWPSALSAAAGPGRRLDPSRTSDTGTISMVPSGPGMCVGCALPGRGCPTVGSWIFSAGEQAPDQPPHAPRGAGGAVKARSAGGSGLRGKAPLVYCPHPVTLLGLHQVVLKRRVHRGLPRSSRSVE